MPAGFGYGAIGGAVRKALASASIKATVGSARMTGTGWGSAIGSNALRYAGAGLSGMSRMSNLGLSSTLGAISGGAYGAMSSDTSVLGGAMMGAGLGAGALGAASLARQGARVGMRARRMGMGVGQATGMGLTSMGRMSSRFIGNTANRAVNGFRGLFR